MSTNEKFSEILSIEIVKVVFLAVVLLKLAKKYKRTFISRIIRHCWSCLMVTNNAGIKSFYPKSYLYKYLARSKPVSIHFTLICKQLKQAP